MMTLMVIIYWSWEFE